MVFTHCQLWMGSVEHYMTETFIMNAFQKMGESPTGVKIVRGKNQNSGYCFVSFHTDEQAIEAMHKLNGKPVPGSNPPLRFRLNTAGGPRGPSSNNAEANFSVWVGDLSSDVDDFQLYRTFAVRYNTIKTAKVVNDGSGFSKGYGFVKFGSEDEQKHCLQHMDGFNRLGSRPLRISAAVPKKGMPGSNFPPNGPPTGYPQGPEFSGNQYFDPSAYWQNYAKWQGYYDQNSAGHPNANSSNSSGQKEKTPAEYDLELIEHSKPIDIDQMNRELFDQDRNLWDALESSKWLACDVVEAS